VRPRRDVDEADNATAADGTFRTKDALEWSLERAKGNALVGNDEEVHVHAFVLDGDPSEAVVATISSRHALLISATHDAARGDCLRLFDLGKTIVVVADSSRRRRSVRLYREHGPPPWCKSRNEREKDLSRRHSMTNCERTIVYKASTLFHTRPAH
jgi:hypothetical protein